MLKNSPGTHRSTHPNLCDCILFSVVIISVHTRDFTWRHSLCLCESLYKGRKKLFRQSAHSVMAGLRQRSCKKWSACMLGFVHKACDSGCLSVSTVSSCVIIAQRCLKGCCILEKWKGVLQRICLMLLILYFLCSDHAEQLNTGLFFHKIAVINQSLKKKPKTSPSSNLVWPKLFV